MRQQNVRIEHAVDDRIVRTVAITKEGSRVIVDHIHPRVVIRMLGMVRLAECDDRRIDLDRVHRLGAEAQRCRYVVAGAGPDDHDAVERRRGMEWQLVVAKDFSLLAEFTAQVL